MQLFTGARCLLVLCAALAGTSTAIFLPFATPSTAFAQAPAKMSNQQLDSLTAPIALYPDALLAQVLMAATFPQEVQAAAAWSRANARMQGDNAVRAVASQPWDPSVQSLVAFPQVLATMDSKPEWVEQLGNAFLANSGDVMDSVQRLRKQAQQAGHLKSTDQQRVVVEQSTIQIAPANPQVVYVPAYNPTVVYGVWPYPAWPPVYIPPPPGYAIAGAFATGLAFGAGIAVANSLWGGFNWNSHTVNVNVNNFNNINVNHRLNVNGSTTAWNRNAMNVSNATRNMQLDQYRGREASREQAMQTLQARTGESFGGSATQRLQGIQHGGSADRSNWASSARNINRDNALRDAGDGNAARQQMQRGLASRNTLASNANMARSARGERVEPGRLGRGSFEQGRSGGGAFGSERFGGGRAAGGLGGGGFERRR
ncbi:DUF3300 domain-containing protein [Burkholderia sp. S-53]|uniref:DUF3300 domain-containing protein n=1 Tax=Burkholderia sp. S-53 TaxID=2906514 RepID=UPI0021CE8D1C|nr:DUF3300 domain-containing protein [Burkholderia sp. S-53]UXU89947.1 DUF3300 domain-containing protein [Burkholderia sp. S-53]